MDHNGSCASHDHYWLQNEPGKTINGLERHDGFDITAVSEPLRLSPRLLMIYMIRANGIGRIVVAYDPRWKARNHRKIHKPLAR